MTIHQTARRSPTNYLTRMVRGRQDPDFRRRKCNVLFNAFFPLKGVRQICKAQLRVLDISEDGLRATSRRHDIPDHFYVSIGDKQFLIACAVVSKEKGLLEIRFLNEMPTVFIDVVASLEDPLALLGPIRPALYGLEGYVN